LSHNLPSRDEPSHDLPSHLPSQKEEEDHDHQNLKINQLEQDILLRLREKKREMVDMMVDENFSFSFSLPFHLISFFLSS